MFVNHHDFDRFKCKYMNCSLKFQKIKKKVVLYEDLLSYPYNSETSLVINSRMFFLYALL